MFNGGPIGRLKKTQFIDKYENSIKQQTNLL